MNLVLASDQLVIGGQPFSGFPILLWDDMQSCSQANDFFQHYLLRGAIGSKNSWPSTGRAIYDYFSFLQAHELSWRDVDRGEQKSLLAAYREYSFEIGLKRNTVRQRLLYICEFYEYALNQGWVARLPYGYEDRVCTRPADEFAHVHSTGGKVSTRDVLPRKHKNLPKFLSKAQVTSLLLAAENPHHRMILRLALQTGLRREELATFPTAYVFNPDSGKQKKQNIRITLDPQDGTGMRTKGMKARDIYVSHGLMSDLHRYLIQTRGERAALSTESHSTLFLNQEGQPYADAGKRIHRIVRDLGKRVGLKVTTHMLRHTYATHTLSDLQRRRSRGGIEPLVYVQRQLGHRSINTTMIYLHLVDEHADAAVIAYDEEINACVDGIVSGKA